MSLGIELSKDQFEEFITSKIRSRLPEILWGENCDSLKDALTFTQEWLFGDSLDFKLQPEMEEYLFKSGFCPRKVILQGKMSSTWCFPFNTKNATFARIRAEYETGLNNVWANCESSATDVINNFSSSRSEIFSVGVQNTLYRKCILEKLAQYNRALLVAKNDRRLYETRDYIFYVLSRQEDILWLSKSGNYYGYVEQSEASHDAAAISEVSTFLAKINMKAKWCQQGYAPRRLVTYVASRYVQDFKKFFEPLGFEISVLPKYSEKNYFPVGIEASNLIPIFIEVPKVYYRPLVMNNGFINTLYMEFCGYYR